MVRREDPASEQAWTRRRFLQGTVAAFSTPVITAAICDPTAAQLPSEVKRGLAFEARGKEYGFDTGALRGSLRAQGQSRGLLPLMDGETGAAIARGAGLFSHYRLLDAEARYGVAAWEWSSQSRLLSDGTVEATWRADAEHPFDLTALYRWTAPNVFDVTTSVVARKAISRFESFLASYFNGFAKSFVYVKGCPATNGKTGFLEATKSFAAWHMYPRDGTAVKTIEDGRWTRLPHPVEWEIAPQLAAPLALRRDAETGLAGLVMTPREDCFAVATPFGEDSHRSLYLSLLGQDLAPGQRATACARLVIGRDISDEKAVALYEAYLISSSE